MKTNTDHPSIIEQKNEQQRIPILSKFGETTFLDHITVVEGAPQDKPPAGKLESIYNTAKGWEWQWRTAMAFRELSDYDCAWITLTYATEPATWITGRSHISQWLKRLRDYHRRVLWPSDDPQLPYRKPHYLVVEEEGTKNGRMHFHALVFTHKRYNMRLCNYQDKLIKWPYGFK